MFGVTVAELVNYTKSATLGVATLGESMFSSAVATVESQIPGEW